MDGESDALGRELNHYGAAVWTEHRKSVITDCRDRDGSAKQVYRRVTVLARRDWNATIYQICEDGIALALGPEEALREVR